MQVVHHYCPPQLLSRQVVPWLLSPVVMHFLQWDQCNVRPEPLQFLYFFPLPQGQGALRPTFDFPAALFGWGEARVFPVLWTPCLSKSSLAMRSSPHPILPRTISRMSARSSGGIGGRPGRDFHRQNSRKPARCQPINVFGVTFTKASFHANTLESSTSINRDTLSKRRGLTLRSW